MQYVVFCTVWHFGQQADAIFFGSIMTQRLQVMQTGLVLLPVMASLTSLVRYHTLLLSLLKHRHVLSVWHFGHQANVTFFGSMMSR